MTAWVLGYLAGFMVTGAVFGWYGANVRDAQMRSYLTGALLAAIGWPFALPVLLAMLIRTK